VDVRKLETLQQAVERCVKELGGIDFVMYGFPANLGIMLIIRPVLERLATSLLLSSSFLPMRSNPLWILIFWALIIHSRRLCRI
jgi:hypothetical protein